MTNPEANHAIATDWILDGCGNDPIQGRAVWIERGRIKAIVPTSDLPATMNPVSYPGCTLLPGLIDAHVHLTCSPSANDLFNYHAAFTDSDLLAQGIRNAAKALDSGVTTVRDLGGRGRVVFELMEQVRSGKTPGPHIVACGRPLTSPRGHVHFMGGEIKSPGSIRRIIEEEHERGARVVKVIATGGGLTPGSNLMSASFSEAQLRIAVEAAHRINLPAAAHVGWGPVIEQCARKGFDTLEHCTFITPAGLVVDAKVIKILASVKPFVVPTRYQFYLRRNDKVVVGNLGRQVNRTFADLYQDSMCQLSEFLKSQLRIVSGSDAGIPGMDFDGVIGEIETLVRAGWSTVAAIATATGHAADAVGVAAERGRIREGLFADMFIVRGAVHREIVSLRNPVAVFQNGKKVGVGDSAGTSVTA